MATGFLSKKRSLRCFVLSSFVFILIINFSGCSRYIYKSAYNNLDYFLLNSLDSYFDLRDGQKKFLSKRLKVHHRWHRKKELSRYAKVLNYAKTRIGSGLKKRDVHSVMYQFKVRRTESFKRLIKDCSKFLATLDKEQITYFEKKMAESNKKFDERARLSSKDRYKKRYEETIKFIKYFTDDLEESQEKKIFALIKILPDMNKSRLIYRKRFQRAFIALLRSKPGQREIEKKLNGWFIRDYYSAYPAYQNRMKKWNSSFSQFLVKLDKLLTKEQRDSAIRNINNWITDIRELSAN